MKKLVILFVLSMATRIQPVAAQCSGEPYAYQAGERLSYEVAYNWGLLWVNAGEVFFKVDTVRADGKTLFSFDSYGSSYRVYDLLFKVRDHFQAKVEKDGFRPVWFNRDTYEGGYKVDNTYAYEWEQSRVISSTENTHKPGTVDTLSLVPCTFDVLSAIYYARNLDFDHRTEGEKIPLRFLIDGEVYDLFIRYLGKEVKENRSGNRYLCHKFSAMLVEGTIFAGGEDMVAWITADPNKVPIMVEAKILIGSIKAYLTGYEGLVSELEQVN